MTGTECARMMLEQLKQSSVDNRASRNIEALCVKYIDAIAALATIASDEAESPVHYALGFLQNAGEVPSEGT